MPKIDPSRIYPPNIDSRNIDPLDKDPPDPNIDLLNKSQIVMTLHSALLQGTSELETALPLLKRTLEEELWRHVTTETGKTVKFARFIDFVEASPPEGLGTTFEQLWDLCDEQPVILDLLDQAVVQKTGAPERIRSYEEVESSTTGKYLERPTGTSRQAGLRRLRKQAPHLHQAVLEGKMSVNAALIEAGLRIKQMTVFIEPSKASEALKRAFESKQLMDLIEKLILGLSTVTEDFAVNGQAVSKSRVQRLINHLEKIKVFARDTDDPVEDDIGNVREEEQVR